MRRRLVVLALVVAGLVLPLPRALPAPAQSPGAMVLAAQPTWVPPDGAAVLELRFSGPVEGLEVQVTGHRAVTSRSALAQAMGGKRLGAVEGRLNTPVDSLPLDGDGDRLLVVGIQGPASPPDAARIVPGRTGLYPLEVELRRREGLVTRFVTPLVVLAPGLVPITLAWVWRLDATPSRLPDGRLRPAVTRAVTPGGRLARMAEALAAATDVRLTLAPTPETLEAWADLARKSQQAGDEQAGPGAALAQLRATAGQPTWQVLGASYVPLDMPALLANELGAEIDRHFARGAEALGDALGTPPPTTTLLAGPLDGPSLGRLRQYGAERVVVTPSALEPVAQRLTPGRPFSLGGRGRPFTAAVADPELSALLQGNDPPALRAARFFAALSLVALEAPRERRGVVVVTPAGWDPPAVLLDAVLTGLRSHPAVIPQTLDGFFTDVPPEGREDGLVTRSLRTRPSAKAPVDPKAVQAIRRRLAAFTQVMGEGEPGPRAVEGALLTSQAEPLAPEGREGRGGSSPRAYLTAGDRLIEEVTGRVRGPDGQRVTLTARRASIPISLLNANPRPLQVLVRLESDQLRFPGGSERLLTLPPQNTTERFAVETRAPGAFPLRITVTSPDGQLLVNRSKLTIRSTVVSGVGALLTTGAGVFLLIWWGNDLRRQRRRRRRGRRRGGFSSPTPG